MIWTKDQKFVFNTNLIHVSSSTSALYIAVPKDFDETDFGAHLKKGKTDCFFNVTHPRASFFFKAPSRGPDAFGYCFDLPESLYKLQRRSNMRYLIQSPYTMKVEFPNPLSGGLSPGELVVRKIADLSAGGMSFFVSELDAPLFPKDMILGPMKFKVRLETVTVRGQVQNTRLVFDSSKENKMRVGIKFIDLKKADEHLISEFVMQENRKFLSRSL